MPSKAENRFITRVHKKLKELYPEVYAEKTYNPLRGGTPDCFYEGKQGYHWIEYKWLAKPPVRSFTLKLTDLQLRWLHRAADNGRKPWVVLGFPGGCFIIADPEMWGNSIPVSEVEDMTIGELCISIYVKVTPVPDTIQR